MLSESKKNNRILNSTEKNVRHRRLQLTLLKLLMTIAYSDERITAHEMNVLKDYAFGLALTKEDWEEISFYRLQPLSRSQLLELIDQLLADLRFRKEKAAVIEAVRKMGQADKTFQEHENKIIELIQSKVDNTNLFFNIIRRIVSSVQTNRPRSVDENAKIYGSNPVEGLLRVLFPDHKLDFPMLGARLGLFLAVTHAGFGATPSNTLSIKQIVAKESGLGGEAVERLMKKLLEIPRDHFELSRLTEIINERTEYTEKVELLFDLFLLVTKQHAVTDEVEGLLRNLRHFLLISLEDFAEIKQKSLHSDRQHDE